MCYVGTLVSTLGTDRLHASINDLWAAVAVARVQFVEPDVIMDIAAAVPTATSSRIVDVGVVPGVNPCTLCAAVSRASLMFSN